MVELINVLGTMQSFGILEHALEQITSNVRRPEAKSKNNS